LTRPDKGGAADEKKEGQGRGNRLPNDTGSGGGDLNRLADGETHPHWTWEASGKSQIISQGTKSSTKKVAKNAGGVREVTWKKHGVGSVKRTEVTMKKDQDASSQRLKAAVLTCGQLVKGGVTFFGTRKRGKDDPGGGGEGSDTIKGAEEPKGALWTQSSHTVALNEGEDNHVVENGHSWCRIGAVLRGKRGKGPADLRKNLWEEIGHAGGTFT